MPNRISAMIAFTLALLAAQDQATAQSPDTSGLKLDAKIPLGNVSGRIDHMAIDLAGSASSSPSLATTPLDRRPQWSQSHSYPGRPEGAAGVAYLPPTDTVYVANAGDGSVRLFRGPDHAAAGQIDLGDDADNIRLDIPANRIIVGYGSAAWQ